MGLANRYHDHEVSCNLRAACKWIPGTVACSNSFPAAAAVLTAWLKKIKLVAVNQTPPTKFAMTML